MIILRNKEFSRTLPKSRVGIGWAQDRNGKTDAETYFRAGQKAADEAYAEGKSNKKVVSASKNAATKKVLIDNSGKPTKDAIKYGAGAYLLSKFGKDAVQYLQNTHQLPYNSVTAKINTLAPKLSKHAGKIAIGAALLGAAKHAPKILKKNKSARLGAEINAEDRLRISNKDKK